MEGDGSAARIASSGNGLIEKKRRNQSRASRTKETENIAGKAQTGRNALALGAWLKRGPRKRPVKTACNVIETQPWRQKKKEGKMLARNAVPKDPDRVEQKHRPVKPREQDDNVLTNGRNQNTGRESRRSSTW